MLAHAHEICGAPKPDSIEAIQECLAHELDSIEAPPAYDDCILDGLALAGYQMGFDNGKFEVEAKIFAIDAAWVVLDIALTEVILGPLGGAKLAASGLAKGSKALKASLVRLGEILIFLPVGVGFGGFAKVKPSFNPYPRGCIEWNCAERWKCSTGQEGARAKRRIISSRRMITGQMKP